MSVQSRILHWLTRSFKSPESPLSKPSDWLVALFGGDPTDAGVRVTEGNALKYSAVYACVRILSETIAALPLFVLERLQPRGKKKATDHPLFFLLHDQPNPEMTSFNFREAMMAHLLLWGNAYAEIVRGGGGQPVELWPLDPRKVRPTRDENKRLIYEITVDGGIVPLEADRVLHIPGLGFDGLKGFSPISMARQAIGLGLATETFGARFFGQGANLGGILTYPGKLTEKARDNIRESFDKTHKGLDQAHKTALFEEGLKWQATSVPPEDAQFLQTRKFQIEEIARIYRVPPHMLAQLEKATFSNIEQQAIEFVQHTVLPWLRRWEQVLNWKLLRPDERRRFFTGFNVDGLLRGDSKARMEFYKAGRQWGWLSANDVLDKEDENPIGEQGDVYLVPLNMVSANQFVDGGPPALASGGGPRSLPLPVTLPQLTDGGLRIGRERLRTIFGPMFTDAAGRIVSNEVSAVRRAITDNLEKDDLNRFHEWLIRFYKRHSAFYHRAMTPALETYAEALLELKDGKSGEDEPLLRVQSFVGRLAKTQISLSMRQLQHIIATTASESLSVAMNGLADLWEKEKAAWLAGQMVDFERDFQPSGGNGNDK